MSGRKIAVIGGGISGLTAAYILARTDEVTVFEAGDRLGGHADTHLVPEPGGPPVPVDTGFIVYNEHTYPLLNRLFRELGVMTQASEMSMSVSCSGCGVQYAGKRGLAGLGAGLRRGGPRYLRMLAEVPRFHRAARRVLASGESGELSLADFLRARGFSAYFTTHFAAPLVGAVWSCPPDVALRYPAGYLFAFLANHGMLSVSGSPPWRTVSGGSRCYVERIAVGLAKICLSSPVVSVRRYPDGVQVRDASGEARDFDAAVIATHPDQALRMLDTATREEQSVLGAFRYTPNQAVLHTDTRLLPARASVRASWNYSQGCGGGASRGTAADQLLPEPAPGPADGARDYIVTLGGYRRHGPGAASSPVMRVRPSRLHAGVGRRAVAAAGPEHHGHGLRRRLPRLGVPRGRLPVGVAAARALGGVW